MQRLDLDILAQALCDAKCQDERERKDERARRKHERARAAGRQDIGDYEDEGVCDDCRERAETIKADYERLADRRAHEWGHE